VWYSPFVCNSLQFLCIGIGYLRCTLLAETASGEEVCNYKEKVGMRSKLVLAALMILSISPVFAQVAPAVKIGGLPLGIGAGVSDYSIDYGPGRRMLGASVWADYNLFHGLGIAAEGNTIFADKPAAVTRMRQDTAMGGAIYRLHPFFGIRPHVQAVIGIGSIDFPSGNPFYTHDTYTTWAYRGGGEYKVWKTVYARADYEYQFWHQYHGPRDLNPNGFTIGATYYLRGIHGHR
jgi:opacity protein-like surface antigen